jgi:hypothetical protein
MAVATSTNEVWWVPLRQFPSSVALPTAVRLLIGSGSLSLASDGTWMYVADATSATIYRLPLP